MVKTKQRQLVANPGSESNTPSGLIDSSNSINDLDLHGEDGWVIVKKQRVTILVPPLPAAKRSTQNLGPSLPQATHTETANNEIQQPIDIELRMPSADAQVKSMSLDPKVHIQFARKVPAQDMPTLAKSPRLYLRMEPGNPDQFGASKFHEKFGVSNTSKATKRPRLLHCPNSFLDGGILINQRLRASNLERKLQKAGGLSRWLASLGLSQFVRIFQRKNVNNFQLVNLTMKKLKDMGANAVGPRRKLIHAIDCVCQPYCFEAF